MAQMKYRLNRLNQYPFMTVGLIVIMVLVYGAMTLDGGSTNVNVLITFGAKLNALIQQGEWLSLIHI